MLILFPGALGDLLCCWPAIHGLIACGHAVTLASRVDVEGLLPDDGLHLDSLERREITALFAATPDVGDATRRYLAGFERIDSFTGFADPRFAARLATAAGSRTTVHPFRGMRVGESAVAYFGRCLGISPRIRPLPIAPHAASWADALWDRHGLGDRVLAIHPGSGGIAKNWRGMAALAERWRDAGGHVVALLGPAESERGIAIPADVVVADQPLPLVAAVVCRAGRYVGNDSGISHLAGMVGASTLVLFADSDRAVWAPRGPQVTVLQADPPCVRCGAGAFCLHRLAVARVFRELT